MPERTRELSPNRWLGYAVAIGATALVVSAQLQLRPWLGDSLLPLLLAVLAAAWYGGGRAGAAATALGAALAVAFLLQRSQAAVMDVARDGGQLAVFLLLGLLVSRACEAFRCARQRLEAERSRLRESDAFHGAIADLSTDFAFSARVEPDGTVVPEAVTEGFGALLGWTISELQATGSWHALLHPDERAQAHQQLQRLLRGHTVEGEARHLARDRRVLLLHYRVQPLWDARGRVVRVYGAYRDVTRERRAEQRAREREQQLRLVADTAPVLIAHCDAERRFKFVNRPFATRFGLQPSEVPGRTLPEVIGFHAYELVSSRVDAVLSGERVEFEADLPLADGEPQPVRVACQPERDGEGEVVGFVAVVASTAEQRRAQEELRKGEERLRLALEGARQGTWDWDLGSGHVSWDDRCSGIFGWTRAAVLTYEDHVGAAHPDDRDALVEATTAALRDHRVLDHEHRIVSRDGSLRWVQVRGRGYYDGVGRPFRMSGTVVDVTERKRLEDALRESESRFRQLAEAIPHVAFTASPQGAVEYVNSQWHRFTGRPEDESFGLGWLQVLHPDDYAGAYQRWIRSLHTGEPLEVEYRFRGGDGSFRWHLCRALAVRDAEGRILRWVGTSTDVHAQKQLQRQLERSQEALRAADRRKDEFLATLAHELRNPLNPIRSAVQVLRVKGGREPEQQWSRDVIDRQVDHLTRLIDDLLDISRISRGKLELRRETIELADALRAAVEAARPLVAELGHDLRVEIPREPLYVDGDQVRLTQVFLNLLNNAAKYTERGGSIRVQARREGERAVVSVRDTGVGIAPEKLPHLFEMFYQVDSSLERAQGGLGIGLSLVKQLVAMHGGSIVARSEGAGLGSEFVVELPLQPAPARTPREEAPSASPQTRSRYRVLVADDNADSAASLALVLQVGGHQVATAGDGEEALRRAERDRPEVVLLDLGMPKLNGYEVCRRIRSQPWGKAMLLVAQTGWGQDEDRRRTREAGFDAHLVKPVDPAALERVLDGLAQAGDQRGGDPPRVH